MILKYEDFINEIVRYFDYDIGYDEIETYLEKVKVGDYINIYDKLTKENYIIVYNGLNNGYYTGKKDGKMVRFFPSKYKEIVKIGNKTVESYSSYKANLEDMRDVEDQMRKEYNKDKFRGAYHHSKRNRDL